MNNNNCNGRVGGFFKRRSFRDEQPPFMDYSNLPHMRGNFPPVGLPPMFRGRPPMMGNNFSTQFSPMRPGYYENSEGYSINRPFPSASKLDEDPFQEGASTSRIPYKAINLTKPWVTESVKLEFARSRELLSKAKESKLQEDWTNYTKQRNKCSELYNSSLKEYSDRQVSHNNKSFTNKNCSQLKEEVTNGRKNFFDSSSQGTTFACDSCERSFPTESAFNKHMSEHRVCGVDGCTLSAHEKIIEKHIQMQHSTGIYARMKGLNSPENVAKWIEERKSRFPSKENIEKRQKEQEESWKKGIRIGEKKNKLGQQEKKERPRKDPETFKKDRAKFILKQKEKREKMIKKFEPKIIIDDKSDHNNGLAPFRGIKELFETQQDSEYKISDDEEDYIQKSNKFEDLSQVPSSLGALMAYGSDLSEEENEVKQKNAENQHSENEGPLEIKFKKTTAPTNIDKIEKLNKKSRTIQKKPKKQNVEKFKTSKATTLEKILDSDIRRERNIILQCVRYTIQNNFFD